MRSGKKRCDAEFKQEEVQLADNSKKGASTIDRDPGLYRGTIRTGLLRAILVRRGD